MRRVRFVRHACIAVLGGLLVRPATVPAQSAPNWRVFRAADGLRESLCTAVTISPRGNVWVKHDDDETISWLDGYSVGTRPAPGSGKFRVLENRTGQLWTYSNWGLMSYQNDQWAEYLLPAVEAEVTTNLFRLLRHNTLLPTERNRTLVLLADRLIEYNATRRQQTTLRRASDTRLGRFAELVEAQDGGAWISAANGLAKLPAPAKRVTPETPWQEFLPPADLRVQNFHRPFEDDRGGVCVVAEAVGTGKRMVICFHPEGRRWESFAVPQENIRLTWRGEGQTFWAQSVSSLFHFDPQQPGGVRKEHFVSGQMFDVAVERKGVFWLATSEGLVRYAPSLWRLPPEAPAFTTQVHAVLEDREERLWFGTASGLLLHRNGAWHSTRWPDDFEPLFQAEDGMWDLPDGRLLISAADRLLRFDPSAQQFGTVVHPARRRVERVLGQFADGRLIVHSKDPEGGPADSRLELFDGRGFTPFVELPANWRSESELFVAVAAPGGDLWLGSDAGPLLFRDQKWQLFGRAEGYVADKALGFLDAGEGRVWCGGLDRILEYDGKQWRLVRAGFDRIHSLSRSRDGSVWVTTSSGLYRYYKNSWVQHSVEEGLPSAAVFAVREDRQGRLWVGTSRGLSRFHPDADTDPPRTLIEPRATPPKPLTDTPVTVVFGAHDKWQYTPGDRLLYSHRLDGGAWSPYVADTALVLTNLVAGQHAVEVRAMDRNWNEDPQPAYFEFAVVEPWYRDTRSLAIALGGAVVALVLGGIAVNRHLRLVRSYAEIGKIVQQRTQELERAQRELFHSQKMKALGTLAAGIAHDFNSILSIIKGSAQIIEANLTNPDKILTRVDRIKTVVEQGSGVVKVLLGFSRASEKETGPCDVSAVVDATMKLLGDQFLQGVSVRFEPAVATLRIPGSKDLLQQMLLNLILNAADAMGGQGEIVLRCGSLSEVPTDTVLSPAPAENYIELAVQDCGCGIEPEILPRIFEPFFTTKAFSARRGTGLGLSMVYQFAKEMGYGLRVQSTVGQGSMFSILIPLQGAAAERSLKTHDAKGEA
jgi:signal transduction histidine kinase